MAVEREVFMRRTKRQLVVFSECRCWPAKIARFSFDNGGWLRCGGSSREAKSRLGTHGYNVPAKGERRTATVKFLFYFRNPLLII
jgi:hypothetical protein